MPSPVAKCSEPQHASPRAWQIHNRILLVLPPQVLERVLHACRRVEVPARHVIYRHGAPIENLHFVNAGLVSFLKSMEDGRSVEIGAVGAEGLIGLGPAFEGDRAVTDCVAQLPVTALRISRAVMQREILEYDALRSLITQYHSLLSDQLAQVSACNCLHSLEQRFCHWLLVACDSAFSAEFQLSHEFLAVMLGAQRPSVSIVAKRLQRRGFIRYSYGHITIISRAALEERACECYRMRRQGIDEVFRSRGT